MTEQSPSTLEGEIWKPVVGFEGLYEVSNLGRVRNVRHSSRYPARHVLSPYFLRGYPAVRLCGDGRRMARVVHSLVTEAFIGPRPKGNQVNHIDGIKINNAATNLEYVTPSGNKIHALRLGLAPSGTRHWKARLTPDAVRSIRALHAQGLKPTPIAQRLRVSVNSVKCVISYRSWRHVR